MAKEAGLIKGNMLVKPTWYLNNSNVQIVIHPDDFEKLAKAVSVAQKANPKRAFLDIASVGGSEFTLVLSYE